MVQHVAARSHRLGGFRSVLLARAHPPGVLTLCARTALPPPTQQVQAEEDSDEEEEESEDAASSDDDASAVPRATGICPAARRNAAFSSSRRISDWAKSRRS